MYLHDSQKHKQNLLYMILPIEQAKQFFYKRYLENLDQAMA